MLRAIAGAAAGVVTKRRFAASWQSGSLATPLAAVADSEPEGASLQDGDVLLQLGRPERALAAYEQAVQNQPRSIDVLCRLAVAQAAVHEYTKATNSILKAGAIDPNAWKPRWAAAQVFIQQGEWQHALQQLRLVVKRLPGETPPLLALAELLQRSGQLDEAIATYQTLLDGDPQHGEATYQLGQTLRQAGELDQAIAAFKRVPPADAHYTAARVALVETAVQQGKPDVIADDAARVASLLNQEMGDLREVQAAWARYCYAAARLAHEGKLPAARVKLVDREAAASELIRLGDRALREALRKAPGGTPERERLTALWQERPWTLT